MLPGRGSGRGWFRGSSRWLRERGSHRFPGTQTPVSPVQGCASPWLSVVPREGRDRPGVGMLQACGGEGSGLVHGGPGRQWWQRPQPLDTLIPEPVVWLSVGLTLDRALVPAAGRPASLGWLGDTSGLALGLALFLAADLIRPGTWRLAAEAEEASGVRTRDS